MDLKDIEGVGEVTLQKLSDAGYETLEDMFDVTIEELISIGIQENIAMEIMRVIEEVKAENAEGDTGEAEPEEEEESEFEEEIEEDIEDLDDDENPDPHPEASTKTHEEFFKTHNKYLVAGFKVSKHYKKDMTESELINALEIFKKE